MQKVMLVEVADGGTMTNGARAAMSPDATDGETLVSGTEQTKYNDENRQVWCIIIAAVALSPPRLVVRAGDTEFVHGVGWLGWVVVRAGQQASGTPLEDVSLVRGQLQPVVGDFVRESCSLTHTP